MKPITTKAFGVVVLALLIALPAIAQAQVVPVKAEDTASRTGNPAAGVREGGSGDDYLIGADDVLAINVWKEPDLSRTVPVRPDGRITLPLIGDIAASGTTPRQLQASIEQDLTKFIAKPAVTVIVQEAKSHKFNIVGEVQKPGAYVLTGPLTVLDAIALAGGFRDWAKVKSIYVLRPGPNGSRSKLAFNYKKVIKGNDVAQNIQLKTGDTVVVP
jgi:polysaccharide export outer membrane protein